MSIDFHQITPRSGGQAEAFEELCCQLAARQLHPDTPFVRLRGAGGDGGVECFSDLLNSGRRGWQAKYVFNIGSLLTQVDDSLDTALAVHPTLSEFIICFPFDLTGPTARKGKSGHEKFQAWKSARERAARKCGRKLKVDIWPAAKLRRLLIDYDSSGGLRAFFFDKTILTPSWFSNHFAQARHAAGPRYSPELNVKTPLWKWFAAFGRTPDWFFDFDAHFRACLKSQAKLSSAVREVRADNSIPAWPVELQKEAVTTLGESQAVIDNIGGLVSSVDSQSFRAAISRLEGLLLALEQLESKVYQECFAL